MLCPTPSSTLFPYTTLFRSVHVRVADRRERHRLRAGPVRRRHLAGRRLPRRVVPGRVEREHHPPHPVDRKSTRLNSSHVEISYAVFCLKKKNRISDRSTSAS